MICRIVYFVIHSYITHDIGIMLSELRDRFGSLQWHLRGLITQSAYLFNQSNRGPILAVVASYSWSIYKAGGKKSAMPGGAPRPAARGCPPSPPPLTFTTADDATHIKK